jgi:hypothetical protein
MITDIEPVIAKAKALENVSLSNRSPIRKTKPVRRFRVELKIRLKKSFPPLTRDKN